MKIKKNNLLMKKPARNKQNFANIANGIKIRNKLFRASHRTHEQW